jgi:hypothetical protein
MVNTFFPAASFNQLHRGTHFLYIPACHRPDMRAASFNGGKTA